MYPRLVVCKGCGLLYGNPILSARSLELLYRHAAFDSDDESQLASFVYKQVVAKYLDQLPDRDSAIDIGAGDGAFCERLVELGFRHVVGIEPSEAPIAAAKPQIRSMLIHGVFRATDFPASSTSLISCFQIMEHLVSPLETAVAALRILKPKGVFVVVVHDQQAFSAKLLGLKSPIYDIEHLQLFTKDTAEQLLTRAGFEGIEVRRLWNRYPLKYWMRLFPFPPRLKPRLLSFANQSRVSHFRLSLPAGNLVLAGIRP
jgi:SAM-dependent methyltransferase